MGAYSELKGRIKKPAVKGAAHGQCELVLRVGIKERHSLEVIGSGQSSQFAARATTELINSS